MTNSTLTATSLLCLTALLSACGGGGSGGTAATPTPTPTPAPVQSKGSITIAATNQPQNTFQPDTDGFSISHQGHDLNTTTYQFFAKHQQQISDGDLLSISYSDVQQKITRVGYRPKGMQSYYYECAPCDGISLTRGSNLQSQVKVLLQQQRLTLKPVSSAYLQPTLSGLDLFSDQAVQASAPTFATPSVVNAPATTSITLSGEVSGSSTKIPANPRFLPHTWTGSLRVNNTTQTPINMLYKISTNQFFAQLTPDFTLSTISNASNQTAILLSNNNSTQVGNCVTGCSINPQNNGSYQFKFDRAKFVDENGQTLFDGVDAVMTLEPNGLFFGSPSLENPFLQKTILQASWIGLDDDEVVYMAVGSRADDPADRLNSIKPSVVWRIATKNNVVQHAVVQLLNHDTQKLSTYACDAKTSNTCRGIGVDASSAKIVFNNQALQLSYSSPVDQTTYVAPVQSITIRNALLDISGY